MTQENKFCQLQLTCKDSAEAGLIARTLLKKRLIACAKQLPVSSSFLWHGKIESSKEILLVMDTKSEFFDQIEKEVAELHSYDAFVLQMIPINKISAKAQSWLDEEL